MSEDTGPIILPPTPKPGRTPAEHKARLDEWTRQAEQAVRKLHGQIQALQSSPSLPNGGTTGQVLAKNSSTNGDVGWFSTHYPPVGGTSGQILAKNSSTDYDFSWTSAPVGLPTGGTTRQALLKNSSTNYDASFGDIHEVPSGGTTGQFLTKNSNTNYDLAWTTAPVGVPTGGATGQVLAKNSSTNYDIVWVSPPVGIPTGGKKYEVLTKNSGTNYDASWKSFLGAYKDGLAIDIFDDYPTGAITAPDGGFGWASAGRVVNGSIITRNLSGGRTNNRLALGATSSQYGRTFAWGGDWTRLLISVLLRLDGSASTFTGNWGLGICSGTSAMWGDNPTTNWQGVLGNGGAAGDPTFTYTPGVLHPWYVGSHFVHAIKVGTTITNMGGSFAISMTVPQDETHFLALSLLLPRSYVATPSTAQQINYNYYYASSRESHQEVGSWLSSILNNPTGSSSDFQNIYTSTASTLQSTSEATGAFDSMNFYWNNTSSVNAELIGVAAIRKY